MEQKKYFVTFGDSKKYKNSLERIKNEALNMEFFDNIFALSENYLDKTFWEKHKKFITSNRRGFGYGNLKLFYKYWKKYKIMILLFMLILVVLLTNLVSKDYKNIQIQLIPHLLLISPLN